MDVDELEIGGVAALRWTPEGGARAGALVLPGGMRSGGRLGGAPSRPDLYYTRALLLELGLTVLEVWWETDELRPGGATDWVRPKATAARDELAKTHEVDVVVGRSLGSIALPLLDHPGRCVWIAPLLHLHEVARAFEAAAPRSFALGGDADPAFDAAVVERARAAGAHVHVIPGGDHGFGVGGAAASARALADALDAMRAFLAQ